jgi:lipid II:glycine glycyltransferase (peptidoglycan interpeptide bridge formation enzyme)
VAAAQLRVAKIPLLKAGVAYATWAPLCRPKGEERDPEAVRVLLETLREVYCRGKGLTVRLVPSQFDGDEAMRALLTNAGFARLESERPYTTVMVDLAPPLEEIKKNLRGNWRRTLKASGKHNLSVRRSDSPELPAQFVAMHDDMAKRKGVAAANAHTHARIQELLLKSVKMSVYMCTLEDEPVCGLVLSAIGDRAVMMLGATTPRGRDSLASYAMWWEAVRDAKAAGFRWLDLGGVGETKVGGPEQFKRGLAGKKADTVRHLGCYEAGGSLLGRAVTRAAFAAKSSLKWFRRKLSRTGT